MILFLILIIQSSTSSNKMQSLKYLTEEQYKEYQENGYLVIKDFVPKEMIAKLKQRITELIKEWNPYEETISIFTTDVEKRVVDDYFMTSADKIRFFLEDGVLDEKTGKLIDDKMLCVNKVGHALHDKDEVFKEFSFQPNIYKILKDLGYRKPTIVQSMYILKSQKYGGEVSAHQDSTFVFSEKTPCVGLWFALDDATKENACLWGIPGSHKKGLASRFERVAENSNKTHFRQLDPNLNYYKGQDADKYIPIEVPAGTLVMFTGGFVHKSYKNTSNIQRHAYTLHCVEGDEPWDKLCWIQREDGFPSYWREE